MANRPKEHRGGARPAPRAGWTLFVLALIWVLNYMDRNIINALAQPIKEDLGISDTQLGLLSGLAFVVLFSVATIPIARLADRRNRVGVISLGLFVWSLMTAATGLATGFFHLLAARIFVGVGEATSAGPIQALLSDYYPKERRGTIMSILVMATFIGVFMAFMVGTQVNAHFGWRATFFALGLPGLLVAALCFFTVKELPRGAAEVGVVDAVQYGLKDTLAFLLSQKSYVLITTSLCLAAICNAEIVAWIGPMLQRVHHLSNQQVGLVAGPVMGLSGIVGALVSASIMTPLMKRDIRWSIWAPLIGMLVLAPAMTLICLAQDVRLTFVGLVLATFSSGFQNGPLIAAIYSVSKVTMRALAGGLVVACLNILGFGAGPLIVGALSDHLAPQLGDQAVRYAMLTGAAAVVLAAVTLVYAARRLQADIARIA